MRFTAPSVLALLTAAAIAAPQAGATERDAPASPLAAAIAEINDDRIPQAGQTRPLRGGGLFGLAARLRFERVGETTGGERFGGRGAAGSAPFGPYDR
ncbi:MAG: hypothetical protein AAF074_26545 [Pseudomonadota bacterium]